MRDLASVAIQIRTVSMHYCVHASVPYFLSVLFGAIALDSLSVMSAICPLLSAVCCVDFVGIIQVSLGTTVHCHGRHIGLSC